jgi:hypothetical protein
MADLGIGGVVSQQQKQQQQQQQQQQQMLEIPKNRMRQLGATFLYTQPHNFHNFY